MSAKKFLTAFIAFMILLIGVFTLSSARSQAAYAADEVTVTQSNGHYLYTHGENSGEFSSLQELLDEVRAPRYVFASLHSSMPITVSSDCVLSGDLSFELGTRSFALTVDDCRVNCLGLNVTSDYGCIMLGRNGSLTYTSGTVTLRNPIAPCSVLNLFGDADLISCSVVREGADENFCYGINTDGTLILRSGVRVYGDTALCISGGSTTVLGGEYEANEKIYSTSGYGANVLNGSLEVIGGGFRAPIRFVNPNADLTVNCAADIILLPSASPRSVRISGKTICLAESCTVRVSASDEKISLIGLRSSDGYRTVGFDADGTVVNGSDAVFPCGEFSVIKPIESNKYTLDLIYGESAYSSEQYVYGSAIRLSELPSPDIPGYMLVGFKDATDFTLTDDTVLEAELTLCPPQIELDDVCFTYDKSVRVIEPEVSYAILESEYRWLWERSVHGVWTALGQDELAVKNVSDSGLYRFTAKISHNGKTASSVKEITVDIKKGELTGISYGDFSGEYSPNATLSESYPLPAAEGFRWVNPDDVPTCAISSYPAIYNPDSDNYVDLPFSITVKLDKTYASAPPHGSVSGGGFARKRLGDFPLNRFYRWREPETVPVPERRQTSYAALYNPDADNYYDTVCYVTLILEPGSYSDEVILPPVTTSYAGGSFYAFSLPEGYKLDYTPYELADYKLTVGTHKLKCVYTGDKNDVYRAYYNDYRFELTVYVYKGIQPQPTPPTLTGVYKGLPLSAYALPQGYTWKNPDAIPTVTATQYAAYFLSDGDNYYPCDVSVTLILEKGTPEISIPEISAFTYSPTLMLEGVELGHGWSWAEPTTVPSVFNDGYYAVYVSDDENYLSLSVKIPLTVLKAEAKAEMPSVSVVYDGEAHYLEGIAYYPLSISEYLNNGHTEAGGYTVTAIIYQSDTDNYTVFPSQITATLTILKSEPIIVGTRRYDITVGSVPDFDASVQNSEQAILVPEVDLSKAGVYIISLTAEESRNYLAGKLDVTVAVNDTVKFVGKMNYESGFDGSTLYGSLSSEYGVPYDAEIAFTLTEKDYGYDVEISVTVDGEPRLSDYTAEIRMTDGMLKKKIVGVFCDDEEIEYYVKNGTYLVLRTDGRGTYKITAEKKPTLLWLWITLPIILMLSIGVAVVILFKKGKIRVAPRNNTKQGKQGEPDGTDETEEQEQNNENKTE